MLTVLSHWSDFLASMLVMCVLAVVTSDARVQDAEDARRDEEERGRRSDQMRKDRAAVRL